MVGQVTIQLAGVGMQDMQYFLELVYTGRVRYGFLPEEGYNSRHLF